tara:strand:- start:682 stop:855 length:174 start_codon:yes stop_codon:yes gene_type:complete
MDLLKDNYDSSSNVSQKMLWLEIELCDLMKQELNIVRRRKIVTEQMNKLIAEEKIDS